LVFVQISIAHRVASPSKKSGKLGTMVHTRTMLDEALPRTPMIAAELRRQLRNPAAKISRPLAQND